MSNIIIKNSKSLRWFLLSLLIGVWLSFPIMAQSPAAAEAESAYNPDLDYAQVRYVEAYENTDGSWRFSVTLRHADTGWDHYADLWQIVDPNSGEVLGERVLAHPHTSEQPFTRSLSNVEIPAATREVLVRAKCNLHGYEGRQLRLPLDGAAGEDFEVHRRTRE